MIDRIKEIIDYRELLKNLTVKELKLKYKNSVLGFFWSFLNPLLMLVIYTFAFKFVLKIQIENFSVFLLAGMLPWTFFQVSIMGSTNSLVNNAGLIKKVYFPREIMPLSLIFSNFVNFLITFIILFAALFVFKIKVGFSILLLPIILVLLLLITIGLSLILSALNVVYRDVSHFVEIIFMAWFYATPVVYSFELVPDKIKPLILLNPMTLVVQSVRDVVIYNKLPPAEYLLRMLITGIILIAIGYFVFSRIEKSIAESI